MSETSEAKKPAISVDLSGRVALVTGAGKGLGRASALALAEAGAQVIGIARTEADLAELKTHNPAQIDYWVADLMEDEVYGRIEALERLDIAVTSAGGNKPEPLIDATVETLDWMMDLNLKAVIRSCQSAARVMLRRGSGSIINISSQMGHVGAPNRTIYCATKHGVEGLTKALGVELAPQGVRVNSLSATFVNSEWAQGMFEANPEFRETVYTNIAMGELAELDDIASAVLFLASPGSKMMTGSSLRVDGGWTAW